MIDDRVPETSKTDNPVRERTTAHLGTGWSWIGIATAAEVTGKLFEGIESVRHAVTELIPHSILLWVHRTMSVLVAVGLLIGYILVTKWLVSRLQPRRFPRPVLYSAAAVFAVFAMMAVNIWAFPNGPDADLYARRERAEWISRLLPDVEAANKLNLAEAQGQAVDPTNRPQVWSTAQALRGLLTDSDARLNTNAVRSAYAYIERVRLEDTRDRPGGWGYFEEWTWPVTEIGAWVGLAEVASLEKPEFWPQAERTGVEERVTRDLAAIAALQQTDGGWSSIPVKAPQLSRTYPTVMALWFIAEAKRSNAIANRIGTAYDDNLRNGLQWLSKNFKSEIMNQNEGPLGWVPNPSRANQHEVFNGLNAHGIYVLARVAQLPGFENAVSLYPNFSAALTNFLSRENLLSLAIDKNDRLHDVDRYVGRLMDTSSSLGCSCPYTIEASTFLWYPWSVAAAQQLANNPRINPEQEAMARDFAEQLLARLPSAASFVQREPAYVQAEFLIGVRPSTTAPGASAATPR